MPKGGGRKLEGKKYLQWGKGSENSCKYAGQNWENLGGGEGPGELGKMERGLHKSLVR